MSLPGKHRNKVLYFIHIIIMLSHILQTIEQQKERLIPKGTIEGPVLSEECCIAIQFLKNHLFKQEITCFQFNKCLIRVHVLFNVV